MATQHRPLRPAPPSAGSSGFSLLEVLIGLSVLTIGLLAMTSTSLQTHELRRSDAARLAARNAMESMVREVEVTAASIDTESGDWAELLIDAFAPPNDVLETPGLDPWEGEEAVVQVRFFPDETADDAEVGFALGMPRDLNGDGFADSSDVTSDARMLPAVVSARWQSPSGDRQLLQGFYVLAYGTP